MSSRTASVLLVVFGAISCFLFNEGTFMIIAMLVGGAAIAPTEREVRKIHEVLYKKKTANSRATRNSYYIKPNDLHEKSRKYRAD